MREMIRCYQFKKHVLYIKNKLKLKGVSILKMRRIVYIIFYIILIYFYLLISNLIVNRIDLVLSQTFNIRMAFLNISLIYFIFGILIGFSKLLYKPINDSKLKFDIWNFISFMLPSAIISILSFNGILNRNIISSNVIGLLTILSGYSISSSIYWE